MIQENQNLYLWHMILKFFPYVNPPRDQPCAIRMTDTQFFIRWKLGLLIANQICEFCF